VSRTVVRTDEEGEPPIAVLTTGGTIASTRTAAGVVSSSVGEQALATALADASASVHLQQVLCVNGFAIQLDQMLAIARAAVSSAERYAGVVVTHGTDTLEETAYLTDLMYDGAAPIVFTGAQRSADDPGSDGPGNLHAAVCVASARHLQGHGVVVAMNGRVDAARDAVKVHSHAARAFAGGEAGPVAELGPAGLRVLRCPARRRALEPAALDAPVALVKLGAGDDGYLIEAARDAGARGVVVEAFGLGNANPAVVASVRSAVEQGVLVLLTTRCAAGGVAVVYGAGGAVDLADAGAVLAGTLTAVKARILLLAALGTVGSTAAALRAVRQHL
jgi:L-asparaginase